jgi:hypothetical protein
MLNPVQYVIAVFGSSERVARAIGRNRSSVSRWQKKGQIPTSVRMLILEIAKREGLDITSVDLDYGRSVAK